MTLITGAARSLGHAIAQSLAREGAIIIAVSRTERHLVSLIESALPLLDKDRLGFFLVFSIQDYCNHEDEKKKGGVCQLKLGVHKNIGWSEEKRPNAEIEEWSNRGEGPSAPEVIYREAGKAGKGSRAHHIEVQVGLIDLR